VCTLIVALPILVGCASVARPPGGPEDHAAPEIIGISIDTNATNVTAGKIDVLFDEVISEHPAAGGTSLQGGPTLDNVVLVSPRTGPTKVSWHRDRLTIEPKGGFKANTTYRITLLPGISDIRGNVRREPLSFVFSTGASAPPFSIVGQVFDWQTSRPAGSATVEAIANAGTKDSLSYLAITDSTGRFDVGPLDAGKYLLRGFIDADNNRAIGPLEKWDTVTVDVTDHRPVVELLTIQRDTAPIGIQRIEVMDSTWLRVTLDKPFDPRTTLQPALVILKRADSSEVTIAGVMTEGRAASERPRPDSTPRRDSTRRPTPPRPLDTVSTRPPAAKPSLPPPEQVIVVHLGLGGAVKPEGKYIITIRGIRNLVGRAGTSSYEFSAPKPPPPPPPPPPKPPVPPASRRR
jgi:hypothetical protein